MPKRKQIFTGDIYEHRRKRRAAKRLKSPALDNHQRLKILSKIEMATPSTPWTAIAVKAVDDYGIPPDATAGEMMRQLAELGVFPPPADSAKMRICPAERRLQPKNHPARLFPGYYVRQAAHNAAGGHKPKCACEECHAYDHWERVERLKKDGLVAGAKMGEIEEDGSNKESSNKVETPPAQNAKQALLDLKLTPNEAELLILLFRGFNQTEAAELLGKTGGWASIALSAGMNKIAAGGYVLKGNNLVLRLSTDAKHSPENPVSMRYFDPSHLNENYDSDGSRIKGSRGASRS